MELKDFFENTPKAAIAFSGGVDSSYLLYAALNLKADVKAYYVKSAFQPQFELQDAERLARELEAELCVIDADVLSDEVICQNPQNRCYYCKKKIFSAIAEAAENDGYSVILDGTNASDDEGDRPGIKALRELKVMSPLRECGLTKSRIRELSKEAGLFTWNKPAYACLATRIPSGERITAEKLEATEHCEGYLAELGFTDFRVRNFNGAARLQLSMSQLEKAVEMRQQISEELKKYYSAVLLDMEVVR